MQSLVVEEKGGENEFNSFMTVYDIMRFQKRPTVLIKYSVME